MPTKDLLILSHLEASANFDDNLVQNLLSKCLKHLMGSHKMLVVRRNCATRPMNNTPISQQYTQFVTSSY
jgi:hypothetical protein